jgi:PTS system nitrogen regulatory IIA component
MRILDFLKKETVISDLKARTKEEALEEMASCLSSHAREIDGSQLKQALMEREQLGSTALGEGVAIPHSRLNGITQVYGLFARSLAGVDFSSPDQKTTHLFFLLVAPENSAASHLKALARVSRLLKNSSFRSKVLELGNSREIFAAIREEDQKL